MEPGRVREIELPLIPASRFSTTLNDRTAVTFVELEETVPPRIAPHCERACRICRIYQISLPAEDLRIHNVQAIPENPPACIDPPVQTFGRLSGFYPDTPQDGVIGKGHFMENAQGNLGALRQRSRCPI